MSGLTGMDISAVRTLANQLAAKADEIDSVMGILDAHLGSVHWLGADADAFRSDWTTTLRIGLNNVSGALRDASTRATNNANQQEQASAS
jgi:hypothetical protein